MRLKFVKKFIKLIKISNCVCVAVYATVVIFLWCVFVGGIKNNLKMHGNTIKSKISYLTFIYSLSKRNRGFKYAKSGK